MRPFKSLETALLAAVIAAAALAGCGAQPFYEGARNREVTAPPDATRPGLPPYDDYEAERRRLQRPADR